MIIKKWWTVLIIIFFVFIVLGHLVLAQQKKGEPRPSTEPLLVKIINEPTPEPKAVKIINALMPFLLVIGGAAGSAFVYYLQYKSTKRVRMDQVLAEKKVPADAEAYKRMKKINSMLSAGKKWGDLLPVIMQNEDWFFENRLFLPGKFPNKWITARNGLLKLFMIEAKDEEEKVEVEIRRKLTEKIDEAIREIYKDVGASEIKVEPLVLAEKEVKKRAKKSVQKSHKEVKKDESI